MPKLYSERLHQLHIDDLLPHIQDDQREFVSMFRANPNFVVKAEAVGPMIAFCNEDDVIAAVGLVDFPGTGRAMLWLVLARNIARDAAALFKQGMCWITECQPRRRIEVSIDPTFKQAKRLAKLAGFEYEGLMRSYDSFGKDYELWAKINGSMA